MVGILSFYFIQSGSLNREYCENTHVLYEEWDIEILAKNEVFISSVMRKLIDHTKRGISDREANMLLKDYLDNYDAVVLYVQFRQDSGERNEGDDCCDTVEFSSEKMKEILGL